MKSTNFSIIFRHETKMILFSVNFKHCDLRRFVDQHCFFFLQLKSQKCFHFLRTINKSPVRKKIMSRTYAFCVLEKRSLYFDGFIGLRNTHVGDDAKQRKSRELVPNYPQSCPTWPKILFNVGDDAVLVVQNSANFFTHSKVRVLKLSWG